MESASIAVEPGFKFRKLNPDLTLSNPGNYLPLSEFVTSPRLSFTTMPDDSPVLISYLRTKLYELGYATETIIHNVASFRENIERIQKIFKSERATRYKKYRVILDFTGIQNSTLPEVETLLSGIEDSLEFRGKNDFGVIMVALIGYVPNSIANYSHGYSWFDTTGEGYWQSFLPLKLKSSGDPVKDVQQALTKLKIFKGVVDGMFGRQTADAVLQFQTEFELPLTGEVDEETYYQLMMAANAGLASKQKTRRAGNSKSSYAEEAAEMEIEMDDTQVSEPNYWIIKLTPTTWNVDKFQPGTKCWFNYYKEKQKRPEYDLFQKVKPGDLMLGYSRGRNNGFIGTFKVTGGIYDDPQKGEIISFDFVDKLESQVDIDPGKYDFYGELTRNGAKRLFETSKEIFEEMLSPALPSEAEKPPVETRTTLTTLPFFYTEGNHGNKDQLDFENDIGSLAAVMALASVKPPLAIGLFGKWGSGKSFFMEKLYERVNDCAQSGKPEFVRNVVQVKFNSWHYADTNLWACMVTEIFDSLSKYSTNKEDLDELKRLQSTLAFTSKQKEAAELRKSELVLRVSDMEQEKQTKHEKLEDITAWDLLKLVISDKKVAADGRKLKTKKVEEILGNANDIKASMDDLGSIWNKLAASWRMLKNMRGWRWMYAIGIAIMVGMASLLLTGVLKDQYQQWLARIGALTTAAVTFIGYFMQVFKPVRQKFEQGYDRLKSFHDTLENRPEQVSPALIAGRNELVDLKNSIASLNETQQSTQREISEIADGKRLFDFIEQRMSDANYSQQLGMMSWIRRDFNRLDELLRLQYQQQDPKSREVYNPENVKLKIDRIILYIDDLDRCNEDIVVKVLEAIHLLLAFPLFVVVVGVDPRWLNNAINEKYKLLFGAPDNAPAPKNEADETALSGSATSYDYLEKIFQIPFCLKPITTTGRENLIGYLLKNEMAEIKKQPANVVAQSTLPADTNGENSTTAGQPGEPIDTPTPIPAAEPGAEKISVAAATPKEPTPSPQETASEHQKEEAKKEIQITEITQKLTFTDDELKYMKKLSPVFGSSPRTINRFINIYRIIKSHKSLKVSAEYDRNDYGPILILLSIVIGFSSVAQPFIEKLTSANSDQTFKIFLDTNDIDSEIKKALIKYADADLLQITNKIYQDNVELISRFSFRTLID